MKAESNVPRLVRHALPSSDQVEAWFKKRGWVPFAFQKDAWARYLAGDSGLIHAPTGVGKTLAALFGLVLEKGQNEGLSELPLQLLWITPLRALAADTARALQAPLTELGLAWTVGLKTGDSTTSERAKLRKKLPTVLITTPESLSLFLSNSDTQEKFSTLQSVVVDEWHELMGTKRGVQTELALARLREWNPELRTWGLSATMGNLKEASQVLLGTSPKRPAQLVEARLPKSIEIKTLLPPSVDRFAWAGHLGAKLLPSVIEVLAEASSALVFTNTRSQAELWFRMIAGERPDWPIALHHGSLEREIRNEVEQKMSRGELKCVVATSSLDLGIDFSPVDVVLQIGGPKGVARLLQRAGRSGHQPGAKSRLVAVPTNALEILEFAAAKEAIGHREIESRVPLKRALDVLAQHVVTIAAGPGFKEDELFCEIKKTNAFSDVSEAEWNWVLDFVCTGSRTLHAYPQYHKVVRKEDGSFAVDSKLIARRHRMSIGTITSDQHLRVKYLTGGYLGTIEESFVGKLRPGDRFLFAGKTIELVRVHDMTALVKKAKGTSGRVVTWQGGRMPLSSELGRRVRGLLSEKNESPEAASFREMQALAPLLKLQRKWSQLPAPGELLVEVFEPKGKGVSAFLYPFEGRLVHEGLASLAIFRLSKLKPLSLTAMVNDYGIILNANHALPENWWEVFRPEGLLEDLASCLNETEMSRRQFREIARIAGLIFTGYPGSSKTARQLQVSSGLLYDVFSKYDPENLLLVQSRREILEAQLEWQRLESAMRRMHSQKKVVVPIARLSPLAFPLWAERLRATSVSSESWTNRVGRLATQLEKAATGGRNNT